MATAVMIGVVMFELSVNPHPGPAVASFMVIGMIWALYYDYRMIEKSFHK